MVWVGERGGSLPRVRGGDGEETRVGTWLNTQRYCWRNGRLPEVRRVWLDERAPGWHLTSQPSAGERVSLDDVVAFVAVYGRHPVPRAVGRAERMMGGWLVERRRSLRAGSLSGALRAELDARLPGWDCTDFPDKAARVTVEDVVAHHARFGSWPSCVKGTEHYRLGTWLMKRRQEARAGRCNPRVRAVLDAVDPDWSVPRRGRPSLVGVPLSQSVV